MTTRRPLVAVSGTIQELPSSDSLTGLVIGTDVQGYDADIPTVAASQAEMEAGTEAALRSMSPLRVAQAIAALGGGGGASVALSGNITLSINQSTTLTITNFNVFSTYSVAVSAGSVSRSGDSISLTAPSSAQTVTLTVTMDGDASTFALVIQAAGIATPTNSSPSNGAYLSSTSPTFTGASSIDQSFGLFGDAFVNLYRMVMSGVCLPLP